MSNRRKRIKVKKKHEPFKGDVHCDNCGWTGPAMEMGFRRSELMNAVIAVREGVDSQDLAIRCPNCGHASPRAVDPPLPDAEVEA